MPEPAASAPAADFRSRLLIDRYSSVLTRLPLRRQAALADPASQDATTWNVFRTLAQLDPARWVTEMMKLGRLRGAPVPAELSGGVALTLWKRVKPPAERLDWLRRQALRGEGMPPVGRRRRGRVVPLADLRAEMKERAKHRLPLEEPVEVDVIIKCQRSVLFVEIPAPGQSPDAPAESDVSRTFLLRLIDAGLAYACSRTASRKDPVQFHLLLIAREEEVEATWGRALRDLTRSGERLRLGLPHRKNFDPSILTGRVGMTRWSALQALLESFRRGTSDPLEAALLDRLLLHEKIPASRAAR